MTIDGKEWKSAASVDLQVAEHLNSTLYPRPLEIICYHCQQAAEKAIKALIVYFGLPGGMPKVHDLSFLLNQIKNKVNIEERYFNYADILTPYGVQLRYPNEIYLNEDNADKALEYAKEIVQWVDSVIKE